MFSVIISEKGGAERRELFDRTEVNVGRVQGNDLMLPKGNVSKRHARLLFRDGRFIVTDLKSTNGTYVNGRKIAQATIVREGDKIYIGDFVLRIEAGTAPALANSTPPPLPIADDAPSDLQSSPPQDPRAPAAASAPPAANAATTPPAALPPAQAAPNLIVPGPVPAFDDATARARVPSAAPAADPPKLPSIPVEPPSSSQPSSAAERNLRVPRIDPKPSDRHEIISHFPLEHDPDESMHFAVPAPPRVPSSPRTFGNKTLPVPGVSTPPARPSVPSPATPAPSAPTAPGTAFNLAAPLSATLETAGPSGAVPHGAPDRPTSPSIGLAALGIVGTRRSLVELKGPAVEVESAPRVRATSGAAPDAARASAHRSALAALVGAVSDRVDLRDLASGEPPTEALVARIDAALGELSAALRERPDLDADAVAADARRELCELGPLAALLEDEDVTEVQIVRHDHVVALHGGRAVVSDVSFTSEDAVGRVVRKLCLGAGRPLAPSEAFVERRLPRGGRLFALLPRPEDHGHLVVVRKPQRADLSLDDFVRSGTISRAMASMLAQCVAARANILVTGAVGAGTTTFLGALAGAGSTEDRVVVLQEDDELVFNQPHTVSILLGDTAAERARAVEAAARFRPDRLVVSGIAGGGAAGLLDAMGHGVEGLIAGARAATLRQAVLRLTADVAATRPGLSPEVAREWLTSVFDVAIEVARLRDGRHRVLRIAELATEGGRIALHDIFTFSVERTAAGGAIEGSFAPTGVVPRFLEDLAARGVAVDPSLFRRHVRAEGGDGSVRPPAVDSPKPVRP